MNPLKCAFGVSAGKFLGFIIHEKGIEIDPKRIEAEESRGSCLQEKLAKVPGQGELLEKVHI